MYRWQVWAGFLPSLAKSSPGVYSGRHDVWLQTSRESSL